MILTSNRSLALHLGKFIGAVDTTKICVEIDPFARNLSIRCESLDPAALGRLLDHLRADCKVKQAPGPKKGSGRAATRSR